MFGKGLGVNPPWHNGTCTPYTCDRVLKSSPTCPGWQTNRGDRTSEN